MLLEASADTLVRPERVIEEPVPPIPNPDPSNADAASVEYSRYRTGLSHNRTQLSEHRTDLSEYRTDLSMHRTDLSSGRTEMSMRRTGLSYQRTRLSADRTLMSVIRTSLSLIGFGFTIYEAFKKLLNGGVIHHVGAPRNFGLTLIVLGILILLGGLFQEVRFSLELARMRRAMATANLIHAESRFPVSVTFVVAVALLVLGVLAAVNIVFGVGLVD